MENAFERGESGELDAEDGAGEGCEGTVMQTSRRWDGVQRLFRIYELARRTLFLFVRKLSLIKVDASFRKSMSDPTGNGQMDSRVGASFHV